jgi:hypothetical protein
MPGEVMFIGIESTARSDVVFDGHIGGRTSQSAEIVENLGCIKQWQLNPQWRTKNLTAGCEGRPELSQA